jgi:hypothetical protein
MLIERYFSAFRCDLPDGEVQAGDIGDAPGAVDNPLDLGRALRPTLFINDAEALPRPRSA